MRLEGATDEVRFSRGGFVIAKPLAAIAAADIQALVTEGTPEGRSIEFKRELPGAKDSDRKELLADVSSLANAVGGDLIFGVAEMDGVAASAEGVVVANIDAEVLRLDEMIRSGISPRIVGCHTHVVPGLVRGPAVVIRVPRSWNGRLARVIADETPVPLAGTKRIAIHIAPFAAFVGRSAVDLLKAAARSDLMQPFYSEGGWSAPTFNIDGIYTYAGGGGAENYAYLQMDRAGRIESVESWMIPSMDPRGTLTRFPPCVSRLSSSILLGAHSLSMNYSTCLHPMP
jgi:hypothetical protein